MPKEALGSEQGQRHGKAGPMGAVGGEGADQAFDAQPTGPSLLSQLSQQGQGDRRRNLRAGGALQFARKKGAGGPDAQGQGGDKASMFPALGPQVGGAAQGDRAPDQVGRDAPGFLPRLQGGDVELGGGPGPDGAQEEEEGERALGGERDEDALEEEEEEALEDDASEHDLESSASASSVDPDERAEDVGSDDDGPALTVNKQNRQGALGDCWLISTINAMALRTPELLTRRLIQAGEGQVVTHIRLNYVDDQGVPGGVYDIPVSVGELPTGAGKVLKYANKGKKRGELSQAALVAPLLELAAAKQRAPDKGNGALDTKSKKDLAYGRLVATQGRKDDTAASAFRMLCPPGTDVVTVALGAKADMDLLPGLLREGGEKQYPAVLQTMKYSVAASQELDYRRTGGAGGLSVSQGQHAITVTGMGGDAGLSFRDQGNQKQGVFPNAESLQHPTPSTKKTHTKITLTEGFLDRYAPKDGEPEPFTTLVNMGGLAIPVEIKAAELSKAREIFEKRQGKKADTQAALLEARGAARKGGAAEKQAAEDATKTRDAAAKKAGASVPVHAWIPVVYSPEALIVSKITPEAAAAAPLGAAGDLKDLLPKPKDEAPKGGARMDVARRPAPPSTKAPAVRRPVQVATPASQTAAVDRLSRPRQPAPPKVGGGRPGLLPQLVTPEASGAGGGGPKPTPPKQGQATGGAKGGRQPKVTNIGLPELKRK